MVDLTVEAFVKIVSTTPRVLTATSVSPRFTGHIISRGTKPTCVSVSRCSIFGSLFHFSFAACSCNHFFSTGNCAEGSGLCECRKEFTPPHCDSCSFGYYGYPDCRPCECFLNGTKDLQCEALNGQCPCLYNFGGQYCRECASGFFSYPDCKQCECNPEGSVTQTCEQETGNCTCKNNFGGKHCDECQAGYYNYPSCSCKRTHLSQLSSSHHSSVQIATATSRAPRKAFVTRRPDSALAKRVTEATAVTYA
jgi:hypothetical protein